MTKELCDVFVFLTVADSVHNGNVVGGHIYTKMMQLAIPPRSGEMIALHSFFEDRQIEVEAFASINMVGHTNNVLPTHPGPGVIVHAEIVDQSQRAVKGTHLRPILEKDGWYCEATV